MKLFLYKNFKIIKTSNESVELAAKIARDSRNLTGKKLKLTDAIIAATTILENKSLLTLDKEDFKGIKDLKLV